MRSIQNKNWVLDWDEQENRVTVVPKMRGLQDRGIYLLTAEAYDLRDLLSALLSMPERNTNR